MWKCFESVSYVYLCTLSHHLKHDRCLRGVVAPAGATWVLSLTHRKVKNESCPKPIKMCIISQFLGAKFDGNIHFPQKKVFAEKTRFPLDQRVPPCGGAVATPSTVTDFPATNFYHHGLYLVKISGSDLNSMYDFTEGTTTTTTPTRFSSMHGVDVSQQRVKWQQ